VSLAFCGGGRGLGAGPDDVVVARMFLVGELGEWVGARRNDPL
jgi:hypothetical protein